MKKDTLDPSKIDANSGCLGLRSASFVVGNFRGEPTAPAR
jgi:hypothetical protein